MPSEPENPLLLLRRLGQSVWYDFIRRSLLTSGELAALRDDDGVCGVTSNPAIFEKAIAGSADYDEAIEGLERSRDLPAEAIYEHLAMDDIRRAADVLTPVYEETDHRDGYVSLEVSPYLANETDSTIEEARRLWLAVGRPNVMIKVPATAAGLPAIRRLIGDGININVTLLFAQEVYEAVADAFIGGIEQRVAAGKDVASVASVASFFVSRIDTLVDELIDEKLAAATENTARKALESLRGKIAIANAKLAYAAYQRLFAGSRWRNLAAKGAKPQRLLWASTSTKNPRYETTLYIDQLIGPDTVNTVPVATLSEFRSHGRVRQSLTENLDEALATMAHLAEAGISMRQVTTDLLEQGVRLFADAFDHLLAAVEQKRRAVLGDRVDRQICAIGEHQGAVDTTLEEWRVGGHVRRLWHGDSTLWTGAEEDRWLGWLHLTEDRDTRGEILQREARDIAACGFRHAVLLGMGGSSLCPDVLRDTFGLIDGAPDLLVLDSTVPEQIRAVERSVDLRRTLCIVSSKSGGTTETALLKRYFFDRIRGAVGPERVGNHFIAVTDPGSPLERQAKEDGFRHVFAGDPAVGGRFSALSDFGMVPAAIAGLDVETMLAQAERMAHSCGAFVPPRENPGVILGIVLGTLGRAGRDKVTIVASPGIATFGTWLEQLIAESTGKEGKGLIPVADEWLAPPDLYTNDRLFAYARLETAPAEEQDRAMDALEAAGHPVVRMAITDKMGLGQEFFRWEVATAVAGALLGINPFDQPDVEAAKAATRSITTAYERTGTLDQPTPLLDDAGIKVFTDARNAEVLRLGSSSKLEDVLRSHLARLGPGDYFAVTAYVAMTTAHHTRLQTLRHLVRDRRRNATTLGYGPRFLHSTGQLHKGGPNTGVFLQVTTDDAADIPIPGQDFTFGVLKNAQALGDFQVLARRGRRLLRVHLGADVEAGLARLERAFDAALDG